MSDDPRTELEAGAAILDPVLAPHGFVFEFQAAGCGSGGTFAWGSYVRDESSLHLHHRWGLGIIEYHMGDLWIDHHKYLTALGVENQSDISWMPLECGLDRYRALRSDIERFCSDFVLGPAHDWKAAASKEGQRRAQHNREHDSIAVGDHGKRERARQFFRAKRYTDVVAVLDSLHYPDMLSPSEERMLEISRHRANGI